MKKFISLFPILLFSPLFNTTGNYQSAQQIKILPKDTIKKEFVVVPPNNELRKKTDSMLSVAENNNFIASTKLDEIKKLDQKDKKLSKNLNFLRKELKKNIKFTVKMLKEKQLEIKEHNKNNADSVQMNEPIIDSIYQKGTLLKKGTWIYHIEIDGKHYQLKK